jgi:hypothetical protein
MYSSRLRAAAGYAPLLYHCRLTGNYTTASLCHSGFSARFNHFER